MTDLSDPALMRQRRWHAAAAALRRTDPLHWCRSSAHGPYWSVLRHQDVRRVEEDPAAFSSQAGGVLLDDRRPDTLACDFMSIDPPHHAAQRRSVQPALAADAVAAHEPAIRRWVSEILDAVPVNTPFDWADRVATELTARMLARLFGLPSDERRTLVRWSEALTAPYTGASGRDGARRREIRRCIARMRTLWRQRAGRPERDDLLSHLAHADGTRDMIDRPAQLIGNLSLLLVGAYDTTRHSISGSALAFCRTPAAYARLRECPELLDRAVDEVVRWQTPLTYMRRTAVRDVRLAGRSVRAGDKLALWYLSANYDEVVFPEPEAFRIDRPNAAQHLGYGHGIHRCLGRGLARLQLKLLLRELLERFTGLCLAGRPVASGGIVLRGYRRLPVRLLR